MFRIALMCLILVPATVLAQEELQLAPQELTPEQVELLGRAGHDPEKLAERLDALEALYSRYEIYLFGKPTPYPDPSADEDVGWLTKQEARLTALEDRREAVIEALFQRLDREIEISERPPVISDAKPAAPVQAVKPQISGAMLRPAPYSLVKGLPDNTSWFVQTVEGKYVVYDRFGTPMAVADTSQEAAVLASEYMWRMQHRTRGLYSPTLRRTLIIRPSK